MNPLLGMTLVAGSFTGLILGVAWMRRRRRVHPELSRKIVHIGMGFTTLSFPWLFTEPWPVWVLSAGFVVTLVMLRVVPSLRDGLGQVLFGIERRTWGEYCFPVAVAIVFAIAHQQIVNYLIPLLVLGLADALAALIGVRFGRSKYVTDEGTKSLEGSLAFFVAAALSTLGPLMLLTDEPLSHAIATAVSIGVLTALIEAISWRGLDNLFLPLTTLVLLVRTAERTTAELAVQVLVALGLLGLLLLWRRYTTFRDNAVAGVTLVLFVCWTSGGWEWLLSPLTVALVYTMLPFRPTHISPDVHGNWIVLSMIMPAFVWLFLEKGVNLPGQLNAYVLACGAQLAMVFLARWKRGWPTASATVVILGASAAAWLIVYLPLWGLAQLPVRSATSAVLALMIFIVTTATFFAVSGRPVDMPNTAARWLRQTALAAVASTAGLLPVFKP
jgi:phytol kinase